MDFIELRFLLDGFLHLFFLDIDDFTHVDEEFLGFGFGGCECLGVVSVFVYKGLNWVEQRKRGHLHCILSSFYRLF